MLTSGQTSADVKVEPRSTFTFRLRVAFHSLPFFHLRTYILRAFARKIFQHWKSTLRENRSNALKSVNFYLFEGKKKYCPEKSRKFTVRLYGEEQVQSSHHTNVCKISRLCGAVSLLSLKVLPSKLVSNLILRPSFRQCRRIVTYCFLSTVERIV